MASAPTRIDERTFGRIYDEHSAAVFRTARSILGDAHAAEDVTSEVFLQLWRRPGTFDPARGCIGSYLRMVARSRALDLWRRESAAAGARRRLDEQGERLHSDAAADRVERVSAVPAVRAAVRRLPPEQREAIGLAYWGELSAPEIASRCGLPLGTVKSRLRLGLEKLHRDDALPAVAAVG